MRLPYRGDKYQSSRDRISRYWRTQGWKWAGRLGRFAGVTGLAISSVSDIYKLNNMISGYKRPRSEARTIVQDPNRGGYQQRCTVSEKNGRKLNKRSRMDKLLSSHVGTTIERFQYVDPDGLNWGRFQLNFDKDFAVDTVQFPGYIFELNSVKNYDSRVTAERQPVIAYRFCRWKPDGTVFAAPVAGRDSDNAVDVYTWDAEKTSAGSGYVIPNVGDQAYIDWLDFRFLFYGAQKVPCDITVKLVSFPDEHLLPRQRVTDNPSTSGVDVKPDGSGDLNRYTEFWLQHFGEKIGNPIGVRGPSQSRTGMKTYWSKTFNFQPTMTTENDVTPHQIEYKWHRSFNRQYNYSEPIKEFDQINTDELVDQNEWPTSSNTTRTRCHPAKDHQMYYLLVTGSTPKSSPVVTNVDSVAEWFPSFDMIMRRQRTRLHIG